MEVMDDNEAIIMQGYEQYSRTSGYAATLKYDGEFTESTMVSILNSKLTGQHSKPY